jgi:hypothetical protein
MTEKQTQKRIKYVNKTMQEIKKAILSGDLVTADMQFQIMMHLLQQAPVR